MPKSRNNRKGRKKKLRARWDKLRQMRDIERKRQKQLLEALQAKIENDKNIIDNGGEEE